MRLLPLLLMLSCTTDEPHPDIADDPQGWSWLLPEGYPLPKVPDGNPMTRAKVELGRHLFFDTRLSGNDELACAGCHLQDIAFADDRPVSVGTTGDSTPTNAPALQNVAYYATHTWSSPSILTLEDQIAIPMFGEHPIEMGITNNEDEVLGRIQADETYVSLFKTAFPDDPGIDFEGIVKSLASFARSMVSAESPFDRFVYQLDDTAMNDSALAGMDLFFSERLECFHCHGGFNLSRSTKSAQTGFIEQAFDNNGLYNVDGYGGYPASNQGLYQVTGKAEDMGRFRPPSLRNITLTAPYMHDGSLETLQEVIDMYALGGLLITEGDNSGDGAKNPYKSGFLVGFTLTEQENADLMAFLEGLSDPEFLFNPAFSDPWPEIQK